MKIASNLKSFAAGFLACGAAFALYSFTSSDEIPPQDGGITLSQAQTYHADYNTEGPKSISGVLEAIQLDKTTINTIVDVLNKADSEGVRVYYGADETGGPMNVVVGTDKDGKDLTKRYMNATTGAVNVCPTVCDSDSPISKE